MDAETGCDAATPERAGRSRAPHLPADPDATASNLAIVSSSTSYFGVIVAGVIGGTGSVMV